MTCERCGGFAIDVSFSGGMTAIGAWKYEGSKCLNCGWVMDPLILRNRVAQFRPRGRRASALPSRRRTRTGAEFVA